MKTISSITKVLLLITTFCFTFAAKDKGFGDLGIPWESTKRGEKELNPENHYGSNVSHGAIDENGFVRNPWSGNDSNNNNANNNRNGNTNKQDFNKAFSLETMPPTSSKVSDFSPEVKPVVFSPGPEGLPEVEPEKTEHGSGSDVTISIPGGNKFKLTLPVRGSQIVSPFGYRKGPFTGRRKFHPGLDFFHPGIHRDPIYAPADGVVTMSIARGNYYGYGKYVQIQHTSIFSTRYGHCYKVVVRKGQRVRRGQIIAYVGTSGASTGPHLHFELRYKGKAINPVPFF